MPIQINEVTSNLEVTGGDLSITPGDIEQIVRIVLTRVKEELEHEKRVLEETTIREQASEIEPY